MLIKAGILKRLVKCMGAPEFVVVAHEVSRSRDGDDTRLIFTEPGNSTPLYWEFTYCFSDETFCSTHDDDYLVECPEVKQRIKLEYVRV